MINKIARFFSFSLIVILFTSCSINKKDVIGKFSFQGKNTVDSLIFEKDMYIHKIYSKNLKLVYKNQNRWSLDKERITLYNFYNNEDTFIEEYLSNEDAGKFLMIASFPIYKANRKVFIEANADEDFIYAKNGK